MGHFSLNRRWFFLYSAIVAVGVNVRKTLSDVCYSVSVVDFCSSLMIVCWTIEMMKKIRESDFFLSYNEFHWEMTERKGVACTKWASQRRHRSQATCFFVFFFAIINFLAKIRGHVSFLIRNAEMHSHLHYWKWIRVPFPSCTFKQKLHWPYCIGLIHLESG